MDTKEAEFIKRLHAMFKIEAREHLDTISTGLADMRSGTGESKEQVLETVYREAHSLKGAARSVNNEHIVDLCQSMESVFSALKKGGIVLSLDIGEQLQQAVDFCYRIVDEAVILPSEKTALTDLVRQLDAMVENGSRMENEPLSQPPQKEMCNEEENNLLERPKAQATVKDSIQDHSVPPAVSMPLQTISETIRISTERLDALLFQAEELISVKLAIGQRATDLKELKKTFDLWKKERQRELFVKTHNTSGNRSVLQDPFIASLDSRLTEITKAAEYDQRISGSMVERLLDDIKKALMLPFSSMFDMLPRMVRDLARSAGIKVELITQGGEIEIDKRVLEEMKPAIIHLIRNAIVHGIELPEDRERKKKVPCGNITINVSAKDDQIEITVADDGRGIDVESMKASAVNIDLISRDAAEKLGKKEVLAFIFHSGITTSQILTDVSGRGLGLAIVREKVEKLNGLILLDSTVDCGTRFQMTVPLTLATFRGILIRVALQLFILPSTNVERVLRAKTDEVQTVENKETLVIDGTPVALARMDDVLGIQAASSRKNEEGLPMQVVIVAAAEKQMAFVVDEVLREQEVLVKPFGRQLSRIRNIAAATVLGNGKVVPILNVPDLLKTAIKMDFQAVSSSQQETDKSGSVLVVEDSITARTLLRNILEAAGYTVRTAIDGVDAITILKSGEFDVVVSDVEMPRMNGFDLTAKIRSDKNLQKLPVVLVTALDSREDRERGIDVGADAYIVKSSFDQSNLLEVIETLI